MMAQEKLYEKLQIEYNDFINSLLDMQPLQIIQKADEKVMKKEILSFIQYNMELSDERAELLLASDFSLDEIYRVWKNSDIFIDVYIAHRIAEVVDGIEHNYVTARENQITSQAVNEGMVSLPHDKAKDLFMDGYDIYMLFNDNTHVLIRDSVQFQDHKGNFGIKQQDWIKASEPQSLIDDMQPEHEPIAKRYMNVDLVDFLGKIADKVILHYPQDFKVDEEILWKAALPCYENEQRLMWHVGGYGTHLLPEKEVYTKDTGSYRYWVDYRPDDEDMFGYAIEVTGYEGADGRDTVVGNVYEVGNYSEHAQHVRETALHLDSVSLTYSRDWGVSAGKTVNVPRSVFDRDRHNLMSESGNVVAIKYHPLENEKTIDEVLQQEMATRMAMPIGDPQKHLKMISAKLAAIRGVDEPDEEWRTYKAELSDPESPDRMEVFGAKDDAAAIEQAYEYCKEAEGIVLLELHELNEDYDVIRDVDLSRGNLQLAEPHNDAPAKDTEAAQDKVTRQEKPTQRKRRSQRTDR